MPALENLVPLLSHKSLNHKTSRSARTYTYAKAGFYNRTLPMLGRAQRILHERLQELKEPVVIGVSKDGVEIRAMDYKALCATVSALLAAIDQERQLLGFPSPGRRRDQGPELKAAPVIEDVAVPEPEKPTNV